MLQLVDETTGARIGDDFVLDMKIVGQGPALLLLHGVESADANAEFIDELAKSYTVYAPSHPGFGLSPRPTWFTSVDDLAYLYLEWMRSQNLTEVTLVGLQFGGWVASEIAIRDTTRIARLVLIDSVGIKVGDRESRDIADIFATSRGDLTSMLFVNPPTAYRDLAAAPLESVMHIARNEESLALYGWEPFLHNPQLKRWLHRIDVPTLVLWGDSDGVVATDYGRAFAAAIPGARFETIESAAHCAQVDQPLTVAGRITTFTF